MPIKLTEAEVDVGIKRLNEKLSKLETTGSHGTTQKNKMISLVKDAKKRFAEWVNKGFILIEN